MKLDKISKLTGTIELTSGLHIGSGNTEMHIGGTDNPVIKISKLTDERKKNGLEILRLFGYAPSGSNDDQKLVKEIGPTRLAFWDCNLDPAWVKEMDENNLLLTETKNGGKPA